MPDNLITCKEAAEKWNFTERWVSILCKQGRIPGAVMISHRWMLPADTPRPEDNRSRTGVPGGGPASVSAGIRKPKIPGTVRPARQLPLGITDFRRISDEYYYVDKTLLVKEIIDAPASSALFQRPPKFGKTLAAGMLRTFFEKTGEDTSSYFENKKIWSCKGNASYRSFQGKYPVIFLSLKDVREGTWERAFLLLKKHIQAEFDRHGSLLTTDVFSSFETGRLRSFLVGNASDADYTESIRFLSRLLHRLYGEKCVLIIDDYDIPFIESQRQGYETEMAAFLRTFYSASMKDNPDVEWSLLFGTCCLPLDSVFSDFVPARIHDATDRSGCTGAFGFTHAEVDALLASYDMAGLKDQIDEWYGGSHFGTTVVMQPYSVVQCIANGGRVQPYLAPESRKELLTQLFKASGYGSMNHLRSLLQDRYVRTCVNLRPHDLTAPAHLPDIYGMLVNNGFLSIMMQKLRSNGMLIYDTLIPSREFLTCCKKAFLQYLSDTDVLPAAPSSLLLDAMYNKDAVHFQLALKQLIYISIRGQGDSVTQEYYQTLLTGLMVLTEECYTISDVQDVAGDNYEILLSPANEALPSVKIEIRGGKTVKLLYSKP